MRIQPGGKIARAKEIAPSVFIIVTRNRPSYLVDTVKSILEQSVLPGELCVVDSSAVPASRDQIARLCELSGVRLKYLHPSPVGCTVQRNVGIDASSGDPVFFVDDDVALHERCHEIVLNEYERWDARLGGVTASPVADDTPHGAGLLFRRLFGLGGRVPDGRGRVLPGLWGEAIDRIPEPREVEFFYGWFMSYRRAVLEVERFDEALAGYGYKEDLDFSYRVSRSWLLLQSADAKCAHLNAPSSREPSAELRRMRLRNHFYLHRKLMPRRMKYKAALWWGLIGLFLQDFVLAVRRQEPGILGGFVWGVWDHLRGRDIEVSAATRGKDDLDERTAATRRGR